MTPDEDQHLRALLELLKGATRHEALTQETSGAWIAQPGSALASDDAASHPYWVSHGAWQALTIALDHVQCLRASLLNGYDDQHTSTRIFMNAQYSLIRGALENAARAVWCIGPEESLERITRRLQLVGAEIGDDLRVRELLKVPGTKTRLEQVNKLVGLLVAAGVPEGDAVGAFKQLPRYKDIVRGAGALTGYGADALEVSWKACSGLAHGDTAATLNFLDRETVESDGQVSLQRVTGSISLLALTAGAAVQMLDRGFHRFVQLAAASN
jgi:hypothetical protein